MLSNTYWYSLISLILFFSVFNASSSSDVGNQVFKVLSILPNNDNNFELSKKTPIIVIFNRPVIRLGEQISNYFPFKLECNVPVAGKYRWVTNSIARFDPDNYWNANLECSFSIDSSSLKTFDGLKLTTAPPPIRLTTEAPSISINKVFSQKTKDLTENNWCSEDWGILSNGSTVKLNEVPPDGIILLDIYPGYDISYVKSSLVIESTGKQPIPVKWNNVTCPNSSNQESSSQSSLCISILDSLKIGTEYRFRFPKGSQLSSSSGPLKDTITIEFASLYQFKYTNHSDQPDYSTIRISQKHGLKYFVTKEMFENVITIQPKVKDLQFTLLNSYTLQFHGIFKPVTYTISFKASKDIIDGWDLPLETHSFNFTMSQPSDYYFTPLTQSSTYFDNNENIQGHYTYYQNLNTKKCYVNNTEVDYFGVNISGWKVNENNLNDMLLAYSSNNIKQLKTKPDESKDLEFKISNHLYNTSLNVNELWKDSNIYMEVHSSCGSVNEIQFVGKNDISVSQLNGVQNGKLSFFITSTKEPYQPISDAKVEYYIYKRDEFYIIRNVSLLTSGISNKKGLSFLPIDLYKDGDSSGYVVVKYNGKIFIQSSYFSVSQSHDIRNELVTDRKLYNAGDIVHFKGYFRGSILSQVKIICKVYFRISEISNLYQANIVNIDYKYGTFNVDIPIPENVDGGVYTIEVTSDSDQNISFYFGHTFTVSDSKLPTGVLQLSTNQEMISLDDSKVGSRQITLNISTSNYLGQPQNSQKVTITWKTPIDNIIEVNPSSLNSLSTGDVETITDENGLASVTINFSNITINYGDSITFEASYIDPSGQLVTTSPLSRYFVNSKYIIKRYQRSYVDEVPSIPQPISIGILELPDEKPIYGLPVELKLTQWVNKKSIPLPKVNVKLSNQDLEEESKDDKIFDQTKSCKFKTKVNRKKSTYDTTIVGQPDCYYRIPDMGTYVIVANSIAPNGERIQSTFEVGKDEQFWRENLWFLNQEVDVYTEKEAHSSDEPIEIELFNTLNNSKVLIQYTCINNTNYQEYDNLPFGKQKLKIPCPKCHSTVCISGIIFSRNVGFKLPENFPFSRQSFSTHKFHHQTFQLCIPIKSESKLSLDLKIDKKNSIYKPGDKGSLTIQVSEKKSKNMIKTPVEACIMIIDKRNLDLLPNPISNGESLRDLSVYLPGISYLSGMITNYMDQIKLIFKRLKKDSYVKNWYNFDLYDPEFMNQFSSYLNPFARSYWYPRGGRFSGIEFSDFKSEANSFPPAAQNKDFDQVPREDFSTTPLFQSKLIIKDGKAVVPFTLPDDVTTFEIRVYIIQSTSLDSPFEFLSSSLSIISKKDNTIQPNFPSFVRNGDIFELGATLSISKLESKAFKVTISLESESILIVGNSTQLITPTGYSTNIFFKCKSISQSLKNFVTISLYQDSFLHDAFRLPLQVLGRQLPVYIGTSMNIQSNSTTSEGLILPKSDNGSGTLKISAGVGRYPSVEEKCLHLLNLNIDQTPSSIDLLSKQVTFGSLNQYQYNSSLIQKSKEILSTIANSFSNYMSYNSIKWYPYNTQGYIEPTIYGLIINKLLKASNIGGWSILDFQESYLEGFVDEHLNTMVNQLKQTNFSSNVNKEFIGRASIALGHYWSPSDEDLIDLYSWNALTANITDNCSLQCQCYFSIAALIRGEGNSPFIPIVIQNIENNLRIQGRTAYITESKESSYSSIYLTTYASLLLTLSNYTNTQVLDKLMNFIAIGGVSFPTIFKYYPIGPSPEIQSISVISLVLYDKLKSSNNPSLTFSVTQNGIPLINQQITAKSHNPISKSIAFKDLPSENATIYFKSSGNGEISTAIGLEYTPIDLPAQPIYNGISVDKVFTLADGTSIFNCSKQLNTGQEIKVLVSITINDDMSDLTIIDNLPAGISPLDSLLYQRDPSTFQYSFSFQPFLFKETKRDRVIFQANGILAGSYQVEYNAIVTNAGSYTLPPTKVFSTTQPELFGFSTGCKIEIIR